MKDKPWIPTGKLSDGTLLFGPLNQRPTDCGPVVEIAVNGLVWFVAHTGDNIATGMKPELQAWTERRVAAARRP